jgi:hypothetical protein
VRQVRTVADAFQQLLRSEGREKICVSVDQKFRAQDAVDVSVQQLHDAGFMSWNPGTKEATATMPRVLVQVCQVFT